MLKYYDIINKLSDLDKIRILCDIEALSDKNYRVLGIPEINTEDIESLCEDVYPSPRSLANTWDTDLVGNVADALIKKATSREVGFVKLPDPKIKINPYRKAISEDTHLSVAMSREYLKAAQRAEVSSGIGGFGIHHDEIEWLDDKPDERFVFEYIVRPYTEATRETDCAAIFTELDVTADNYEAFNSSLMSMVSDGKIAEGATPICSHVSAEQTVYHLNKGGLFFEGSPLVLESALSRHKQLTKKIERGTATVEELQEEVSSGKAISSEMIDEALDRLLDFAFKVKRKPNLSLPPIAEDLPLKASEEAIVLLKNQNKRLPLKDNLKISILGDIATTSHSFVEEFSALLSENGHQMLGFERGYDLSVDRGEDLLESATDLAKKSDVVILFLGFPEKRALRLHKEKRLAIPANQEKLLDMLGSEKKKIVAVLPSDCPLDIGFPDNCSAIIMAPISTKYCAKALMNVLSGAVNPSGRLANTLYFNTEQKYLTYKTHRTRDNTKIGPFIGYRCYDFEKEFDGFPFGHGLSYTQFTYSALTIVNNEVSFTVRNSGNVDGAEVAQIYVGLEGSSIIRPIKELCGFARIELSAGEKKTVHIPLKLPVVYSDKNGGFVEETGKYTVYVGSSVSDIKLSRTVSGGSVALTPDQKHISDYIYSESNIISDNFKLEAKLKTMKKSIFNVIAGAVALFLAIILKLYCSSNGLDSGFFDVFCVALVITGISLFVSEAVRRSQLKSQERAALDKLNDESFKNAEKLTTYEAQKMFVDEFDASNDISSEKIEEHVDGVDAEYLRYIDKDLNFELAATEFEKFASERGCKLRSDVVKKLFASLASSRLVIIDGMNDKDFKTLLSVLSTYFESPLFIDRVDQSYSNYDNVLFKNDSQGNRVKTNVNLALEAAKNNAHTIQLAGLTNVSGETVHTYFSAYLSYVKNPLASNHVTVLNERNAETSYYLPKNLWFVMNLASGSSAAELPTFVSDVATVNIFEMSECPTKEQHTPVRKFSYYQMDWLTEKTGSKYAVDEELWKKIDRLEEYVNSKIGFHIGNKLWLCLEKYAYVYLACGGEQINAVDEAVAAKLIVPVISAFKLNTSELETGIDEVVETIFGEDRAQACKSIVNACGTDNAYKQA